MWLTVAGDLAHDLRLTNEFREVSGGTEYRVDENGDMGVSGDVTQALGLDGGGDPNRVAIPHKPGRGQVDPSLADRADPAGRSDAKRPPRRHAGARVVGVIAKAYIPLLMLDS